MQRGFLKIDRCNCTRCTHPNGAHAVAAGHCTLPYPKSRSARVLFPEKELIHLADTTSANLSQIQGRELHNVTVQKTLISIYTNAWHWALPKLGGHFHSCFSRSGEDLPKISLAPSHSSIVGSKPLSQSCGQNLNIASAFKQQTAPIGLYSCQTASAERSVPTMRVR